MTEIEFDVSALIDKRVDRIVIKLNTDGIPQLVTLEFSAEVKNDAYVMVGPFDD